jgi:hypothetical protein
MSVITISAWQSATAVCGRPGIDWGMILGLISLVMPSRSYIFSISILAAPFLA